MNVLHVSRSMGQGGAQKIVYQLCKDSTNNKHFVISSGGKYVSELKKLGVEHIHMPDLDSKNPLDILICLLKIVVTTHKNNINILHSHHRMAAFITRIIKFFKPRIKNVYTAHNVFYNKKGLMRFALKNSTIVAVGEGVKNNLFEVYDIPENRIRIIYNSIEKKPLEKENLNSQLQLLKEKNRILIGNIGRISKQKGMDVFLLALTRLIDSNPNVVGVIIGDGEDRNQIESMSQELDLEKNILFLGYQQHVREIISQLDFVVLSSRWEGLPLTPIEAFSEGKTVVASNISGNNEVIQNQINGLLFETENDEKLAESISYLLENSNIKVTLEQNAIATFNNKYSYKIFIKGYSDLYQEIMSK